MAPQERFAFTDTADKYRGWTFIHFASHDPNGARFLPKALQACDLALVPVDAEGRVLKDPFACLYNCCRPLSMFQLLNKLPCCSKLRQTSSPGTRRGG